MKNRLPVVFMLLLLAVIAVDTVIGQKQEKSWKKINSPFEFFTPP